MKLKTPYKYLLTTTICLITCRLGAIDLTSAQNYVQEGNKNFGEQKWEAAIESYQAALQYAPSAQVYFNLGNTYACLKKPAYALFYFLKAKQYHPRWKELNQCIQQLHTDYPTLPKRAHHWYQPIFEMFSLNTWLLCRTLFFWAALFSILIFYGYIRKNWLLYLSASCALACLLTAILSCYGKNRFQSAIFTEDTAIHFAPTESSPTRQVVPAGTLCQLSDRRDTFTYVTLDGIDGWAPNANLLSFNE